MSAQIALDERADVSIKHGGRITCLEPTAMVLHHVVGMQHVGSDLVAPPGRHVLAFEASLLHLPLFQPTFQKPRHENPHRDLPVLDLRSLILTCYDNACRQMCQPDGGICLVHVLAAGARGTESIDAQIVGTDGYRRLVLLDL